MFKPEKNDGNIEYKLKLINKDDNRINELTTQLRFRCEEGNGLCIYFLGVKDDGKHIGLTIDEFNETINIIDKICKNNNYIYKIIDIISIKNKNIYKLLIKENNNNKFIDIKVCIAGCPDSGKTTLVGSLVQSKLDNGRGLLRSSIFNYIHEIKSGRTSSISHQIIGFDENGQNVNKNSINKLSWQQIVNKSSKIISFLDLCGHTKYFKTTILGLTSSFPDFCIVMIDSNNGIKPITKEHIFLLTILQIPFIIVISKIDLCKDRQNILKETILGINKLLKYPIINKLNLNIKNKDDIHTSVSNFYNNSIVPTFKISCLTGDGLDLLQDFLSLITKNPANKSTNNSNIEFYIDHIFNVNGFGIVVGGHLLSGNIKVNDKLLIGPYNNKFENIIIKTIYSKKIPYQEISAGSYVCLGIRKIDKINIKSGMVIISNNMEKFIVKRFIADIEVLRTHSTTIKNGYEPIFCSYSIRQAVKLNKIIYKNNKNVDNNDNLLRNNDTATVELEFKYNAVYIKPKSRFILADSKCKIVGNVKEILIN